MHYSEDEAVRQKQLADHAYKQEARMSTYNPADANVQHQGPYDIDGGDERIVPAPKKTGVEGTTGN